MASSFKRIEKKFWMDRAQFEELMPAILANMHEDAFGESRVNNIYCDTDDFRLIRNSIERPLFKEKLRIRYYGDAGPEKQVFAEIKRKLNGEGYKRRIQTSFGYMNKLLAGEEVPSDNEQIGKELLEFIGRYHPTPQICISYIRKAYYGNEDEGLRISFDKDLRWCRFEGNFEDGFTGEPILHGRGDILMEVKTSVAMPLWLCKQLSGLKIYQASFSKIGACYENHIRNKERT